MFTLSAAPISEASKSAHGEFDDFAIVVVEAGQGRGHEARRFRGTEARVEVHLRAAHLK